LVHCDHSQGKEQKGIEKEEKEFVIVAEFSGIVFEFSVTAVAIASGTNPEGRRIWR